MPSIKIGIPPFVINVSAEDLKSVWNRILKPSFKLLVFLGTLVVPNGVIVWLFLYRAAENPNRLAEPPVFLSLIAQATIVISLYTVIWGMWLYPRLRPLLLGQKQSVQQSSGSSQARADSAQKLNIEPDDEEH